MADILDSYLITLNVVCAVLSEDFLKDESLPLVELSTFPKEEINELKSIFGTANTTDKERIASLVSEQTNLIKVLWDFSWKVYKNLGEGVPRSIGLSLLHIRSLLVSWCEVNSNICHFLFDIDLVKHLAMELTELKNVPEIDQYTKCLILYDLSLEECLAQFVPSSHSVFRAINFVDILRPFLATSQDEVKIMSKIALCQLGENLEDNEIALLKLDGKEVTSFCEGLAEAVTSDDRSSKLFGMLRLSVLEILNLIRLLVASLDNQDKFLKEDVNILDFIGIVLSDGEDGEKQAAIRLLWVFFRNPHAQKSIIADKEFLIDALQSLRYDSNEEVALLSSCVLYAAGLEERQDISLLLSLAETHYKCKIFESCIDLCNYVDKSAPKHSKESNTARLIKAKALFFSYHKEKRHLKSCTLSTKEYHARHALCYKKVSEVIVLLGIALDQNFIDQEGSRFLDYAMMDHLQNVNSKDRQRCLLCRKKAKLHRSHTWPNAILSAFVSGLRTDDTRKVFDSGRSTVGVLKSASMMTSWMLCTECEEMISGRAETQFVQDFFYKIYDTNSPCKVKEEQVIDYEEWLYYFCVSIIFRGLAGLSIYPHCSEDRLYWLYVQCRHFLLQCVSKEGASTIKTPPKVYIIIGPTSRDDDTTGFINQAIHSPGMCAISPYSLGNGSRSSIGHCLAFIAHCGVINIIVDLVGTDDVRSTAFNIDCQIGKYKVPADDMRVNIMPPGLWKFIQEFAELLEGRWLTRQSKYASKILSKSVTDPPSQKADTFMVIQAVNTDLESEASFVRPSVDVSKPKVVNLLPRGFVINKKEHASSSIQLPQGHVLLLHKHYNYGDGVSETLFLAVGTEGKYYSLSKPYILFFRFIPGLYLYTGFFISPDDYTALEFLPDDEPKFLIDKVVQISNARGIIHEVIPEMMKSKGFHSYYSCLHRIKGKKFKEFPMLDLKCSGATGRCWYCCDLCECCFRPAVVGITTFAHNGTTLLKFCSIECKNTLFPPPPVSSNWSPLVVSSQTFLDFTHTEQQQESKVPPGHKEVLRVHAYKPASKIPITIDFSLCIANGSVDCFPAKQPYVMYHLRSVFLQLYLEFFVDSNLVPEDPVPYYTTQSALSEVDKMKEDKTFQAMLKGSLQSQGFTELESLLQLVGEF